MKTAVVRRVSLVVVVVTILVVVVVVGFLLFVVVPKVVVVIIVIIVIVYALKGLRRRISWVKRSESARPLAPHSLAPVTLKLSFGAGA